MLKTQTDPMVGKSSKWILTGLLLLPLLFTGCQKAGQKPKPKTGAQKSFVMGTWQEPDTLNPLTYQMSVSGEVRGMLYRELVGMDEKWGYFPELAEKIPAVKDGDWVVNPDNTMRVDWTLKKGLKWQDGKPLTPQDFIFGFEMAMHPQLPVASREREELIDRITITGEHTFSVYYKDIYAYADILGPRPMPAHVLKQPMAALKENPAALDAFGKKPLANGPYQVVRWEPQQFIELKPNPNFFGAQPLTPRVVLRIYADNTLLPVRLEQGEMDATSPMVGLTFQQWLDMDKKPPQGLTPHAEDSLTWEHLDFNLDNPILKDPRVRLALVLATDRKRITRTLFEGKLEPSHTWLPPRHAGYDPSLPELKHDPAQAKALLKEASYTPGPGGVLVNKKGEKLSLSIMTTTGDTVRVSVEEMMQDMFKQVGIELVINNQPAKTLFSETLTKRKFPHMIMYAWTFAPWADGQNLWACDKIPTAANGWSGQNTVGLCDKALSDLEKRIARTIDQKERVKLFHEEQALWRKQMPALPLYFRTIQWAERGKVKGFKPTASEVPVSWNAERWTVEAN